MLRKIKKGTGGYGVMNAEKEHVRRRMPEMKARHRASAGCMRI